MERTQYPLPCTFEEWCKQHPGKFERKEPNRLKKLAFIAGSVLCLLLFIYPHLLPVTTIWITRISTLVVGMGFLLGFGAQDENYVNKESKRTVRLVGIRKFDTLETDEEEVLAAFRRKDFEFLQSLPHNDMEPLQLFIYEDRKGREFYCQIRKFRLKKGYEPMTDVMIVSGDEYDHLRAVLRPMKS